MIKIFIFLFFLFSVPVSACQISPSLVSNDFNIGADCQLFPYNAEAQRLQSVSLYFVQYLYSDKYQAYLSHKAKIHNATHYPNAVQTFNYGYRMLVGPLTLEDAIQAKAQLKQLGYKDSFIKYIMKKGSANTAAVTNKTVTKDIPVPPATLQEMPIMKPIFSLRGETVLLPIYGRDYQGKVTRYNQTNLGSFNYQQAMNVCVQSKAHIATAGDYNALLSNTDLVMRYAVKSQFWLHSDETITRVQNQITKRKQSPDAYFNVLCVTN
ncbi:SPOR domain-containing protein [Vibrio rumoiensis]|uniref:SPOR domain-containing protein n=1 Tax=Vibrio rumoiensis 1S-45 TaxID=1188252 RepID=A0A1E5E3Y8_9VIBR|nr:SPOR domain-containing protein [Vibrio rumoiensis]OEF27278.1 hypothetical protein A1QC_06575 [Vibrio rumoiensis 1S-45]